jgi:curli biogenesis system outer membrane secretion channel CsgG
MKTLFATLILAMAIASPGAGATRPVRAATGPSAKRLLQRLPAERMVPHRRVVKFDQRLGNCEGADGIGRPFDVRASSSRDRPPLL